MKNPTPTRMLSSRRLLLMLSLAAAVLIGWIAVTPTLQSYGISYPISPDDGRSFKPGETLREIVTPRITNTGFLPVRIIGLVDPADPVRWQTVGRGAASSEGMLADNYFSALSFYDESAGAATGPFTPTTLAPGESITVSLDVRVATCLSGSSEVSEPFNSSSLPTQVPLRVATLGIFERFELVELGDLPRITGIRCTAE